MANEVFISYSRKDFDEVRRIKSEIDQKVGINCWMDLDGIESDKQFVDVIIKAINRHEVLLFMLSKSSMASGWALKELRFAERKKKRIVLVHIDDSEMTDGFSFLYGDKDIISWNIPVQREKLLQNLIEWSKIINDEDKRKTEIDIKKIKEEIQAIEKEGYSLYAQERRLYDEIVHKKRLIGDSNWTCPVCGTINDVSVMYCPTCTWTFVPFQSAKIDEKRLKVAKRLWEIRNKADVATNDISFDAFPQPIMELINDMVRVEGGTFTMGGTREQGEDAFGDESPTHKVTVSTYYIGKYPITQDQWVAVMGSNPSYFKGGKLPVESVSWYDCQEFVKKLSEMTGKRFRLPTEAEWEYAARGGKKGKRYKYSGGNILKQVGWYNENSGETSHEVGIKSPNELGIYDMSGNIWEWVQDWKGDYLKEEQVNPTGPETGIERVCRGGGWNREIDRARVSYRGDDQPDLRYCSLGLRIVMEDANDSDS